MSICIRNSCRLSTHDAACQKMSHVCTPCSVSTAVLLAAVQGSLQQQEDDYVPSTNFMVQPPAGSAAQPGASAPEEWSQILFRRQGAPPPVWLSVLLGGSLSGGR